jgi:hypothetical protein
VSINPYVVASLISTGGTLAGVVLTSVLTTRAQNRRIDRDNKAALANQTSELKTHLGKGER